MSQGPDELDPCIAQSYGRILAYWWEVCVTPALFANCHTLLTFLGFRGPKLRPNPSRNSLGAHEIMVGGGIMVE